jgi:thiamine biosynthesis lipoprotein
MNGGEKRRHGLNRRRFLQLVAVTGVSAACWRLGLFSGETLQVARHSLPIMGTVLNLTVYGPDKDQCQEGVVKTATAMRALESKLSRHMESSELARLNRHGLIHSPSPELLEVLSLARDLYHRTSGAFDVTMLPLLRLHEEMRASGDHPGDNSLVQARLAVSMDGVSDGEGSLRLTRPGMGLTLDGIGKGYLVDRGVAALKASGFTNVYVEAGGDLMVTGNKEGRTPWRIALRPPRPRPGEKPVVVAVSGKAVATSGDYLQAFSADFRHHHIIDPRSGFSPPELASCTVTAPTVALADGLATALMVLGREDGLALIEGMDGCEAYLVDKGMQVTHSKGFFS